MCSLVSQKQISAKRQGKKMYDVVNWMMVWIVISSGERWCGLQDEAV
jgi:hypothetical protein